MFSLPEVFSNVLDDAKDRVAEIPKEAQIVLGATVSVVALGVLSRLLRRRRASSAVSARHDGLVFFSAHRRRDRVSECETNALCDGKTGLKLY
jgi:hypothetical protein